MRDHVRYLSAGRVVEVKDFAPTTTLLDHLRLQRHRMGTKEGCNEGDCGACTVVLGRLEDGRVVYRPVNACIQLLGQVDGAEVVTIEDIGTADHLHPVQAAMLEHHGSQCGFCTPGIVMSLFALHHGDQPVERDTINDALAGNLCRCTGYRPIVDAALAAGSAHAPAPAAEMTELAMLSAGDDLFVGAPERFFAAPATVESLADLYLRYPDATLVAGATDVGLWITKRLVDLPRIIHLGRVEGLDSIASTADSLILGATATFEAAETALGELSPDLGEMLRRIGSRQVRASGTVGGNIANGSPIGDSPPALIALGAMLELRRGVTCRTMPLEDYFLAYGKQDREPGEFVHRIVVPRLKAGQMFKAFKLSKRYDQDISAVMAAFRFDVEGGEIKAARVAYGGMAATPKRAAGAEVALVGARLDDPASWAAAIAALADDYAPITDARASADYRRHMAGVLLRKALMELAGTPVAETRVFAREVAHG